MRRRCLSLSLAIVAACGADARGARAGLPHHATNDAGVSSPITDAGVSDASTTPPPPDPATYAARLEGAEHLDALFSDLTKLERGKLERDIRILQYGDSHTAADMQTGPMRRALQQVYGDGGRGFVPIGTPWKHFRQEGMLTDKKGWTWERGLEKRKYVGDGMYGLGGISLIATKAGSSAWSDIKVPFSRVDIAYLERPGGGSVDVLIDGVKTAKIATKGPAPVSRFHRITLDEKPHRIEIVARGDGPLRFYGAVLDRAANGIQLDDLGINGQRAMDSLRWDPSHLIEQLHFREPDLLIFALGTNESIDEFPIAAHEAAFNKLVERMRRSAPNASCLLVGPPDRAAASPNGRVSAPRVVEIVEMERRVAIEQKCAFYNEYAAMGGEGSMARWVESEVPPLAQRDYIHLSFPGYARMGVMLANDLVAAHKTWKSEHPQAVLPSSTDGGIPDGAPAQDAGP